MLQWGYHRSNTIIVMNTYWKHQIDGGWDIWVGRVSKLPWNWDLLILATKIAYHIHSTYHATTPNFESSFHKLDLRSGRLFCRLESFHLYVVWSERAFKSWDSRYGADQQGGSSWSIPSPKIRRNSLKRWGQTSHNQSIRRSRRISDHKLNGIPTRLRIEWLL